MQEPKLRDSAELSKRNGNLPVDGNQGHVDAGTTAGVERVCHDPYTGRGRFVQHLTEL
jgi:hypothetical protein